MIVEILKTLKGQRVLVAPLDWGLGHATRCVPIVRGLLAEGKTVVLAGSGLSGEWLKMEFPELEYIEFAGVNVSYGSGNSQLGAMLKQLPSVLKSIRKEHTELQKIVKDCRIDVVISDNRFGLYTKLCQCVYMTHQLMVKMPRGLKFLEPLAWLMHRRYIKKYDQCWVPDVEGEGNLSGDLSHKYPLVKNTRFVGWLSRFEGMVVDESVQLPVYDNLMVVSGPEPHRTYYEKTSVALQGKTLVVRGLPSADGVAKVMKKRNVDMVGHLPDGEMLYYLTKCRNIYCRSGYSSLMDLAVVGRKAKLTPTPGQTEQEYLAGRM